MKITAKDLKAWEACTDGYRWFIETLGDEAEFSDFAAKCPLPHLVGWVCYRAGLYLADDRYTPAIAEALCKVGGAWWLYFAVQDWKDSRKKDLKRSKK
jgi:hypothetical protein